MSHEMLMLIYITNDSFGEFIPEKSDIFSLGLIFLLIILILKEKEIIGMNNIKNCEN